MLTYYNRTLIIYVMWINLKLGLMKKIIQPVCGYICSVIVSFEQGLQPLILAILKRLNFFSSRRGH